MTNRMIQIFFFFYISASVTAIAMGDWDEKKGAPASELVRLTVAPARSADLNHELPLARRAFTLEKLPGLGVIGAKTGADFLGVILTFDQLAALVGVKDSMQLSTCVASDALCVSEYQNLMDQGVFAYWFTVATIGAGCVALILDVAALSTYFCSNQHRLRGSAAASVLGIADFFSVLSFAGSMVSNGIVWQVSDAAAKHLPLKVIESLNTAMVRGAEALAPNLATVLGSICVCWYASQHP